MSSTTKNSTSKWLSVERMTNISKKLGYRQSPPSKERAMYMTPGEMLISKSTHQTTAKFKSDKNQSNIEESDVDEG